MRYAMKKDGPKEEAAENRQHAMADSPKQDRFAALRNAARAVKPVAKEMPSESKTKAKKGAASMFAKGR